MAETINRGPSIQLGPMMGTPISPEPYDGPGLDYQGSALRLVRRCDNTRLCQSP